MADEELTDREFERFRDLIYKVAGIRIPASKKVMVTNRLRRRLRVTGISTFAGYYTQLTTPSGSAEMPAFLDAITTNETYFYRDIHHYEWLGGTFLPEFARASRPRNKSLRIWSAACATGEEPYSIALKVAANRAALASRKITILGTDISAAAIEAAKAGSYDDRAVHLVPIAEKKQAFDLDPIKKRWVLKPEVRRPRRVEARQLAEPDRSRAFRLHLHQKCVDLFRFRVEARRGPPPALLACEGGVFGGRPHRGDLRNARLVNQAQDLALPEPDLIETNSTESNENTKGSSMTGFDLAGLLPYYLDETDEQVAGLSVALLKLEKLPTDETTLRDAFRLIHTIKGSSMVLGFDSVKDLTHLLEAYFDELRSRKRILDRVSLDLCFKCLDALRDYHKELRAAGKSTVDLAALAEQVRKNSGKSPGPEPEPDAGPAEPVRPASIGESQGTICITLRFEPNLPWPDMKAKLVLNRLAAKGRILAAEPPAERLEEIENLSQFRVWLAADADLDELSALADVDGVAEVEAEVVSGPGVVPQPVRTVPPNEPVVVESAIEDPPKGKAPDGPLGAADPARVESPEPAPPVETRKKIAETVRVDVDRLDQLMNLAGELVISKSRFFEIARGLDDLFRDSNAQLLAADTLDRLDGIAQGLEGRESGERLANGSIGRWAAQVRRLRENFRAIEAELDLIRQGRERLGAMAEAIDHLSRISDGIQRGVLEIRMVPIGPLFDRFHRVIRDLKQASDKEVSLRTEGEKTELDKRMIDELGDPLIHLIRNAVDHGLESPGAERPPASLGSGPSCWPPRTEGTAL